MKSLTLLLMGLIISLVTTAQTNQRYTVKHGTSIKDTFKYKDIYLLPSFSSGKVYFKAGGNGSGSMNYNRLTGEMDFIQVKDTLALADKENIKSVVIGSDVFYSQTPGGYLRRVDVIDNVTLAKGELIEIADKRKPSQADNFVLAPTSAGTYNSSVAGMPVSLIQKVDVVFELRTEYYLGNEKGNFKIANKKNLVKAFPEKKDALTKYLEDHTVDFTSLESLQNVLKDIREMK